MRKAASSQPQIKKVGNFHIMLSKSLGRGQYGKVYLAEEVEDLSLIKQESQTTLTGSMGQNDLTKSRPKNETKYYACKVIERKNLS